MQWIVRVFDGRASVHLGPFTTPEEAEVVKQGIDNRAEPISPKQMSVSIRKLLSLDDVNLGKIEAYMAASDR